MALSDISIGNGKSVKCAWMEVSKKKQDPKMKLRRVWKEMRKYIALSAVPDLDQASGA